MANSKVRMKTSHGEIVIELEDTLAPKTVANFLQYVDDKFFDGTIFHRVIPNFMIQGGGFTPNMVQKTARANITNESSNGLKNLKGTLAMARLPQPHTASSQFFINCKDNDFLDKAKSGDGHGYCVFGKVTDGIAVVEMIEKVKSATKGGHGDNPIVPVMIESVTREN
ncbi:MAG: peptidyl-prolyl cis-trans isomerase [Gemmataceae bacterium]|nr:peptidyl-prolyl cis-trans isomerase [Gemmataceae bacterium]